MLDLPKHPKNHLKIVLLVSSFNLKICHHFCNINKEKIIMQPQLISSLNQNSISSLNCHFASTFPIPLFFPPPDFGCLTVSSVLTGRCTKGTPRAGVLTQVPVVDPSFPLRLPDNDPIQPPHTSSCSVSPALLPLWIRACNLDELTGLHGGVNDQKQNSIPSS